MRKENIINIIRFLEKDRMPYIQCLIDEFSENKNSDIKIKLQLEIKNFISNAFSVFDYFSKDVYDKLMIDKLADNKKNFKIIFDYEKYHEVERKVWTGEISFDEWEIEKQTLDEEMNVKFDKDITKIFSEKAPIIEFVKMIQPYSWNQTLHKLRSLNNYFKHFDLYDITSGCISTQSNNEERYKHNHIKLYDNNHSLIWLWDDLDMKNILDICNKIINHIYLWLWNENKMDPK